MERRRPHDPVDRLVEAISERELLERRWPHDPVDWPASLKQLTLRAGFNRVINGVVWPASLQHLTFWDHFYRAIDQVVLPASLQELISGNRFKQVDRHGRVAVDRLAENIFEIELLE